MAQEFAKPFYNSDKWKRCRGSFISDRVTIDGGMCQECKNELGAEVHHIIELSPENITNPDISLNHERLRYLCHNCHTRITAGYDNQPARYAFDINGMPVPTPPYR